MDEETKRKIIDLYFVQHKTIRETAKIIKKSSRDVVTVIKEYKQELRQLQTVTNGGNHVDSEKIVNQDKDKGDRKTLPLHARAYQLYSRGMSPLQVTIELGILELEATKFFIEYLRLKELPELPDVFRELGSAKAISYFMKLSNKAIAERLTIKEVVRLLNIVQYNPLSSVEKRMEEVKRMLICLESELEEQKNLLLQYNEKTRSVKSNLEAWQKACKELQDKFMKIHDEREALEKFINEFKHNNKIYLEIQNVAKDKVSRFLTEYDGSKLLEFALVAVAEALRKDPQRNLLIEKMPSISNHDFASKSFFPNPWEYEYDFPHTAKEKVLESSSELYNKLLRGLTNSTLSTAARIGEGSSHADFYPFSSFLS